MAQSQALGIWRVPGVSGTWRLVIWPFRQVGALLHYLGLDRMFGWKPPPPPFWSLFRTRYVNSAEQMVGLPFFEGSFRGAVDEAKRSFRLVLIYIHSDTHDNSEQFCRRTLQAPGILHVVLENFVLWGGSVQDAEGYKLSLDPSLNVTTFPYMAVLLPIDGRINLVQRMQGTAILSEDFLAEKLLACVENASPALVAARADVVERENRQRLMQEQEREYEEAQRRDRQRLEQRRQQEEENRRRELQLAEQAREEALRKEREEQERKEREAKLQAARQRILGQLQAEPQSPGPDVATIKITLFDGSSVSRRFSMDDPLQVVYDYVCTQEVWQGQEFQLTTPFPVQVLRLDRTLREQALFPRAAVIAKERVVA